MAILRQARNHVAQVRVQAGITTEVVVPVIRKIETDRELIDTGFPEFEVLILGHLGPVGNQDRVRNPLAALDVSNDLNDIRPHERLAAGNLHDAGPQLLHISPVVRGLQVSGLVSGAAVITVLAVTCASIRYLK